MASDALRAARELEYEQRVATSRLRSAVYAGDVAGDAPARLLEAEAELDRLETERAALEVRDAPEGRIIEGERPTHLLGADTTGLVATITLRMAQLPTAIYHLLRVDDTPLVSGTIENRSPKPIRRVRVTSFVDGYSAPAVDTLEIRQGRDQAAAFGQLPTLFPERARQVDELTRATVNVLVEDLEGTGVELHRTQPVWLLARTTAPFAVKDPKTGGFTDLTRYFGAFVTPNDPAVMAFLPSVLAAHPRRELVGYQKGPADVEAQVQAVFDALKAKGVRYVNSTTAFAPEEGSFVQRVRLPAETLATVDANCIDGTVLFASLLEAITLNAAIVTLPGHAVVAWETESGSDTWDYLDTVLIGDHDFAAARERGRLHGRPVEPMFALPEAKYRRWSIRTLRGMGITPTH